MGSKKKKSSHLQQPHRDIVNDLHNEAKAHTDVIYNWLQERRSQINILTVGEKPPITDVLALPRQIHETFIPLPQAVSEAWMAAIEIRTKEYRYYEEDYETRFTTSEAKERRLAIKRRKSNGDHWRLIEALRGAYDFLEACQKAIVREDVPEEMFG
ncbi:MAG: hypothetical protein Q9204_005547 [Flavoplaca sp. TL-2023a]